MFDRFAIFKLKVSRRQFQKVKERLIETILFLCAFSSIFVTFAIIYTLLSEAIPFFKIVTIKEFLTGTEWTPLFENAKYGILPLVTGTLMTTVIALLIAIPMGIVASVYLSEFATSKFREFFKPLLELLAAVPTVVYGYFAMLFVSPLLQNIFPEIGTFNALSAGLVMGIMIIPYVSSLSEDAMRAVPQSLREGSLALGASKFQTSFQVVIPSAFSGIASAFVLAISRAIGETMVVAIAAGLQPRFSFNPTESTATLTAYIVQVTLGDLPHGSIGYQTIYVAGLTLFIFTFSLNIVGQRIRSRLEKKVR
jgi:phosphate transport system permease protein